MFVPLKKIRQIYYPEKQTSSKMTICLWKNFYTHDVFSILFNLILILLISIREDNDKFSFLLSLNNKAILVLKIFLKVYIYVQSS